MNGAVREGASKFMGTHSSNWSDCHSVCVVNFARKLSIVVLDRWKEDEGGQTRMISGGTSRHVIVHGPREDGKSRSTSRL